MILGSYPGIAAKIITHSLFFHHFSLSFPFSFTNHFLPLSRFFFFSWNPNTRTHTHTLPSLFFSFFQVYLSFSLLLVWESMRDAIMVTFIDFGIIKGILTTLRCLSSWFSHFAGFGALEHVEQRLDQTITHNILVTFVGKPWATMNSLPNLQCNSQAWYRIGPNKGTNG